MSNTPDYENPTIMNGGENPDSWDHSKIDAAFNPLVVEDATSQADKYWDMRQLWEEGVETFLRSIQASLAQAWSGPAAEQSKQAIQHYIDNSARPVTPAFESLSAGVRAAANAIVRTKNSVGDPLEMDEGVKGFFNSWLHEDEANRRTEEARLAMATHYVNPFGELDTQVPVLPVPTGPTTTDDPAVPPGDSPSNTGSPGTTTSGTPGTTTPGDTPEGEQPGTPEDTAAPESPGEDQTSQQSTPGDTSTTPAGTETPGTTTPTTPSTTTPSTTNPSGTPSSPGSPGSTSPGSPGSTDSPGRTVQGTPNTTGTPATTGAAASTAAGNRGTSRMGGMPMGGGMGRGGGGQGEESQRSLPDYLITRENTDELLGEIPPTIEGGVIGSNPE